MATPRRPLRLNPVLLLVFALTMAMSLGCAKRASGGSSYAQEAPGYAGDALAYDEYDEYAKADMADMDAPPPSAPTTVTIAREESVASRGRSRSRNRPAKKSRDKRGDFDEDWGGEGEASEPAPEPTSAVEANNQGEQGQHDEQQPQPTKRRQVIYTATMSVSVYDLPAALAFAENLPGRYGGWLEQRSDNEFVLRVPAEQLEAVMEAVGELGVVEARTLSALDVTAQYTDLESRIRVLEEMQAQLQLLLERAKTVEQSLEIRKALDSITLELESARAQMRSLAQSVAFSTLILSFSERGPGDELPSTNDPFSWVDRLGAEATEFR